MSEKIFVHYPACASKKYEDEFDKLIRAHPTLCFYRDRIEISSTPHAVRQMKVIDAMRNEHAESSYLLYALLYMMTHFAPPPTPCALRRRPLFREDRFKARYNAREMDQCSTGIFVPEASGKWPYTMWRNARRLLRQGKTVFVITGSMEKGWRLHPFSDPLDRSVRLNRKETLHTVGEFSEPFGTLQPPLFRLFDEIMGKKDD